MPDVSNLIKRFILPAFIATTAIHFSAQANTVRIIGPEEDQPLPRVSERYREASAASVSPDVGSSYQYGPTRSNETLWGIASAYRPSSSVSVYQVIGAIYRANPNAFENSNIHGLIPGSRLNMPTLTQIRRENTDAVKLRLEQDQRSRPAPATRTASANRNTQPAANASSRSTSTRPTNTNAATNTQASRSTPPAQTRTASVAPASTTAPAAVEAATVESATVEARSSTQVAESETALIPAKPEKMAGQLQEQLDASDVQITKLLESNHLLRVRLSEMQHEVAALRDQQSDDEVLRDEIKDFLAQQKAIVVQPEVKEPSMLDSLAANPWALAAAAFIPGALIAGVVSYLLFGRRKEEKGDEAKSLEGPETTEPAMIPPADPMLAAADAASDDSDLALSDGDDIDDLFAQDDALFDSPEDSLYSPDLKEDDDTLDLGSDDFDIDTSIGAASSISVTGDDKALGLEDMERALDEMDQSSELSSDEALAAMWEQSLQDGSDEQPNFDLSAEDDSESNEALENGMLDQSLLDDLLAEVEQEDSASSVVEDSASDNSNDVVAQDELDALFANFDSPEQAVSDEIAEQAAIDEALAQASAMADPEAGLLAGDSTAGEKAQEAKAEAVFSSADTAADVALPDDVFSEVDDDALLDETLLDETLLDETSTALLDELMDDDDLGLDNESNIEISEDSTALLDELLNEDEQESSLFNSDIEIDENSTALLDELVGDDEDDELDPELGSLVNDFDDIESNDVNIDELVIDENSTELLDELLGDELDSSTSLPGFDDQDLFDSPVEQTEAEAQPLQDQSIAGDQTVDNSDIDDLLAQMAEPEFAPVAEDQSEPSVESQAEPEPAPESQFQQPSQLTHIDEQEPAVESATELDVLESSELNDTLQQLESELAPIDSELPDASEEQSEEAVAEQLEGELTALDTEALLADDMLDTNVAEDSTFEVHEPLADEERNAFLDAFADNPIDSLDTSLASNASSPVLDTELDPEFEPVAGADSVDVAAEDNEDADFAPESTVFNDILNDALATDSNDTAPQADELFEANLEPDPSADVNSSDEPEFSAEDLFKHQDKELEPELAVDDLDALFAETSSPESTLAPSDEDALLAEVEELFNEHGADAGDDTLPQTDEAVSTEHDVQAANDTAEEVELTAEAEVAEQQQPALEQDTHSQGGQDLSQADLEQYTQQGFPVGRSVDEWLEEMEHEDAQAEHDSSDTSLNENALSDIEAAEAVVPEHTTSEQSASEYSVPDTTVSEPSQTELAPESTELAPQGESEPVLDLADFPEFTEEDAFNDLEALDEEDASASDDKVEPQSHQADSFISDNDLPEFDEESAWSDPEAGPLEPEVEVEQDDPAMLDNVVKQLQQAAEAAQGSHHSHDAESVAHELAPEPSLQSEPQVEEHADLQHKEASSLSHEKTNESEAEFAADEPTAFDVAKADKGFEFETIDPASLPEFSEDEALQASFDEQHELEQYDIEQGIAPELESELKQESEPEFDNQASNQVETASPVETDSNVVPTSPQPVPTMEQALVDSAGLDMDALLTDPDSLMLDQPVAGDAQPEVESEIDLSAFDPQVDEQVAQNQLDNTIPIGIDDIESQERDQLLFNEEPVLDDDAFDVPDDEAEVWATASEEPSLASEDWSEQPQMQVEEVDRFDANSLLDDLDDDAVEAQSNSEQIDEPSLLADEEVELYPEADSELLEEQDSVAAKPYISIDELLKESELEHQEMDIDSEPLNLEVGLDEFPDILSDVPAYDVDSQGEYASKLDLAKAYLEMNDSEGAADLLQDIAQNGDAQSADEAKALLAKVR
ncbi:hypothetical protein A3K86_13305 [Photobacterium jeanii]|uniref:EH domain-containing protein n=1 Tax=Photobacterium jeanii TaxID=858640 RepID=A0A178K897_9GAMM|nr:FimV/HubP family polar landmark protein [Photobacterium jeanii]OAN13559.1 hypothetical protein A3K86_13305 [Photobacterium jeanii]